MLWISVLKLVWSAIPTNQLVVLGLHAEVVCIKKQEAYRPESSDIYNDTSRKLYLVIIKPN